MKDTDVIPKIKSLCKQYNMSYYRLAKESSIPYSTLNNMLSRPKNIPTISTLCKICDGFNITLQDFFSEEPTEHHITDVQIEHLQQWNSLNIEEKALATSYIQGLLDSRKKQDVYDNP